MTLVITKYFNSCYPSSKFYKKGISTSLLSRNEQNPPKSMGTSSFKRIISL